jgi:hypothetical protein
MTVKNKTEVTVEWDQIEIGDQVRHSKWGAGTVLFRSGTGTNSKAIVVFPEEGQKKLMLRYAKLKKIGTTSLKSVERMKIGIQAPKPAPPVEASEEEVPLSLEGEAGDEEALLLGEDGEEVAGFDDDEEGKLGAHKKEEAEEP